VDLGLLQRLVRDPEPFGRPAARWQLDRVCQLPDLRECQLARAVGPVVEDLERRDLVFVLLDERVEGLHGLARSVGSVLRVTGFDHLVLRVLVDRLLMDALDLYNERAELGMISDRREGFCHQSACGLGDLVGLRFQRASRRASSIQVVVGVERSEDVLREFGDRLPSSLGEPRPVGVVQAGVQPSEPDRDRGRDVRVPGPERDLVKKLLEGHATLALDGDDVDQLGLGDADSVYQDEPVLRRGVGRDPL
jgi:hypothetical protein